MQLEIGKSGKRIRADTKKEHERSFVRKETQTRHLIYDVIQYFATSELQLLSRLNDEKSDSLKIRMLEIAKEQFRLRNVKEEWLQPLLQQFEKYYWGYDILEELIRDPDISDIRCMDYDNIRIKEKGDRKTAEVSFLSAKDYKQFVNLVAVRNQVNLSDINAIQTFTDNTSDPDFILRFTITTEFLNSSERPTLSIRKVSKKKHKLKDLIHLGMLTREQAGYLEEQAVKARGILFTGKGGSGKTTLFNTLLEYIPHNKSGLFIQENEELFTPSLKDGGHPELLFEHLVMTRGEGKIQYSLGDLTRAALLQDLDYIGIGEIKGDEAADFMKAAYTGHKCWATVHGNNSVEAINKLADYVKQATHYELEECFKMLSGISTVVFLANFKALEIAEIKGYDHQKKQLDIQRVF